MRNLVLTAAVLTKINALRPGLSCYSDDEETLPRHCQPPFENIAFQKNIEASNTCGQEEKPESYCVQTGASGATQTCGVCEPTTHDAKLLTDFNNINKITWWQSQSMLDGDVQSPNSINLTLHLGKAFEITYVRLRFHSPRPESFAIYKKTCGDELCSWIPYQYYSGSCDMTYPLDDGTQRKRFITHDDEQVALCTSDYSDISPLTGGSVAFSTLLARPSAYQFDKSPVLQEWVTAESIRISLNRINTFGDEIFHDPKVLQSYYYAISDLTIGGRCKCNGHASQCDLIAVNENELQEGQGVSQVLQCKCQHNTMGRDCEMCEPLFNDRLWGRATGDSAMACQECDCNGLADSCYFDPDELAATNGTHGGICVDCRENTSGNHCEHCLDNFFKNSEGKCVACACDSVGSVDLQCNSDGTCECKPGVEGSKCESCMSGYHSMDRNGCSPCGCDEKGSVMNENNMPTCNPENGQCHCKVHTHGKTCDSCKDGFMNLEMENEFGCYPCFCYSHIDSCEPSPTHYKADHSSNFAYNKEHWTVEDEYGNIIESILAPVSSMESQGQQDHVLQVSGRSNNKQYFVLPDKFTGEQRFSYGQMFEFDYSIDKVERRNDRVEIDEAGEPMPEPIQDSFSGDGVSEDLVVEANEFVAVHAKKKVSVDSSVEEASSSDDLCFYPSDAVLDFQRVICTSFTSQNNPKPSSYPQKYSFRLHERKGHWFFKGSPNEKITHFEFMSILDQLETIKIKATNGKEQVAEIDNVKMATAFLMNPDDTYAQTDLAGWVEECKTWAMSGYTGQYAQRCAKGYTRQEVNGSSYISCVKCNCNSHSDSCNQNTGSCECLHHTTGASCDRCIDGYYGDATLGHTTEENDPSNDCLPCPCPEAATCFQSFNGNTTEVKCRNCPQGSYGDRCERCKDRYFGDPIGHFTGSVSECSSCDCNNAQQTCDHLTGVCSACDLTNTAGDHCERCADNFYGDPTTGSNGFCKSCDCNGYGSVEGTECAKDDGQCKCHEHVTGYKCDQCEDGYFEITSGNGCRSCNCDHIGSENGGICDKSTGACMCKPGVTGDKCDQCMETYYGMTSEGCKSCDCDEQGSLLGNQTSCDESGQCQCIEGVIGKKCDKCQENYQMSSYSPYCVPCDECYSLVQESVTSHRKNLKKIKDLIYTINDTTHNGQADQATDDQFVERLNNLKMDAEVLKSSAKDVKTKWETAKNQINYIDDKVSLLTSWTGEISDNLRQCNTSLLQSDMNHKESKKIMDHLSTKLQSVEEIMDNTSPALDSAQASSMELSDKFIEINTIATAARNLAKQHTSIHSTIVKQLTQAVSDAQKAISQVHSSIEKAKTLRTKINALRDRLPQIKERMSAISQQAESAMRSTAAAKSRANQILGKAQQIVIEQYNVGQIEMNANTLNDLVEEIKPQIQTLAEGFAMKEAGIKNEEVKLNGLFENAVKWQQEVDKLLAEVMKSKAIIMNSHGHYETAKEMSTDFHQKRETAEQLWSQFSDIQGKVDEASKSVHEVRSRLKNLYELSQDAYETANQANTELKRLTSLSGSNDDKYEKIRNSLENTESKISKLRENVDAAQIAIENKKKQIETQLEKTNGAREKAQQARSMADQANKESTEALKLLRIIEDAIQQLPDNVDREDELSALDEDLNFIEDRLKKSKIGQRIEFLESKNQEVKGSLTSFSTSAELLTQKKENLAEILNKIPDSCPYQTQRTEDF